MAEIIRLFDGKKLGEGELTDSGKTSEFELYLEDVAEEESILERIEQGIVVEKHVFQDAQRTAQEALENLESNGAIAKANVARLEMAGEILKVLDSGKTPEEINREIRNFIKDITDNILFEE